MSRTSTNGPAGISDEAAHHVANDREGGVAGMPIIPGDEHRTAVIDGMRELADYLEDHPDVPVGHSSVVDLQYSVRVYVGTGDRERRAEVDRVAGLLEVEPEGDDHYKATKRFGPVRYVALAIAEDTAARYDAAATYTHSVTPEGGAS